MARFALVVNARVTNIIEAEPGLEHPDGDLIPCEELTVDFAKSRGIAFSEDGNSFIEAYTNNSPLVHGPMSEYELYDLLYAEELPDGLIAKTSGTTGESKLVCTPWPILEQRAAAFMELVGSDFKGPMWFPDKFRSTLGSSTARFACFLNNIDVIYGTSVPDVPIAMILSSPFNLRRIFRPPLHIPKDVIMMAGGSAIDDNLARAYVEEGYRFIDFYSSTEAGSVCVTEYSLNASQLVLNTRWASGVNHRIGIDGTLELASPQISTKYLTAPLAKRGDYFDTRDIVTFTSEGGMRIVGRKPA